MNKEKEKTDKLYYFTESEPVMSFPRSKMRISKTHSDCSQWLLSQLAQAPLGRLSSIRQMAQTRGVSTRTIQKVVQQMKEQGVITSRPGGGLYASHAKALQHRNSLETSHRWEYWAKSLQEEIRNGVYASRIPTQKELLVKWNVSAPLVRRVLRYLAQTGVLEQQGARYFVLNPHQHNSKSYQMERVVLVVAAMQHGKIRMDTHREIEFFRCIEEECIAMGYIPRIQGFDEATGQWSDAKRLQSSQVVGVIYSPWHLHQGQKCLQKILTWGYPVSVWLESPENAEFIKRSHRQKNTAYFSVGYGERPGRDVGKYLHAQGVRTALYISPFHGSQWSKDRLRGLQTQLDQVVELTSSQAISEWTFQDQIEASSLGQVLRELSLPRALQKYSMGKGHRSLLQWRENNMHMMRDQAILQALEPLLIQAISFPAIDAWVFANDIVASLCKEWLLNRHIPMEKKWLSFDNSPEAFLQGINSYDFNTRGMVQSMLLHLRNPQSPLYHSHEVIYPRGRVIERSLG